MWAIAPKRSWNGYSKTGTLQLVHWRSYVLVLRMATQWRLPGSVLTSRYCLPTNMFGGEIFKLELHKQASSSFDRSADLIKLPDQSIDKIIQLLNYYWSLFRLTLIRFSGISISNLSIIILSRTTTSSPYYYIGRNRVFPKHRFEQFGRYGIPVPYR